MNKNKHNKHAEKILLNWFDTSTPRDCGQEYTDCTKRGNTAASVFGGLMGCQVGLGYFSFGNATKTAYATAGVGSGGYMYGMAYDAYESACAIQKLSCEQWNTDHDL